MKTSWRQIFTFLSFFFASALSFAFTVDEWMVLSPKDRAFHRSTMTATQIQVTWNQLSYDQKMALTETNKAYSALLAGDRGIKPINSPYAVNEWITKSPKERKDLRPTLLSGGMDLWEALTTAQKYAMIETNNAYTRLQSSVDLCATSGYRDIQYIDIPISYTRTVLPFHFGNDTMVVARFTVPADYVAGPNSFLDATVAEYQGPPTFRMTSISTKPCDYRAIDRSGVNGPLDISQGVLTMNLINVGPGKANPQVLPGHTYYMNVKNYSTDMNDGAGGASCQENTNCNASITIMIRY